MRVDFAVNLVKVLVFVAIGACSVEDPSPTNTRTLSASSDHATREIAPSEAGMLDDRASQNQNEAAHADHNSDVKAGEPAPAVNPPQPDGPTMNESAKPAPMPPAPKPATSAPAPTPPTPVPAKTRVVVLGIDGMGSDNVWRPTKDGVRPPAVPQLNKIRATGLSTLKATIDEYNYSGPNWAGIVTGSPSSKHGVTSNKCERGNKLPTIYDALKSQRPGSTSAIVYEWENIPCYPAPGVVAKAIKTGKASATADEVIKLWQSSPPDFLFVHFDEVDHAGHDTGGLSMRYVETVERVDQAIGRIYSAVMASPQANATYVFVVADHGTAEGLDHASNTAPVPLFVVGPGLRSAEFTDKVYNYHVAPFAAHVLGLKAPAEWGLNAEPLAKFLNK